jgi:ligand-binding sensor domain-containing protein/AraC-like DNA-binding protein
MRVPFVPGIAAALCLIFVTPPAAAGEPGVIRTQYIERIWNTDSGLPDNSVRALVRTADGYLWLGTPAGLVRFDGVRFMVFNLWNTPSFAESSVLSLYEDINGVLWIGTDGGGLYAHRGGEWRGYGEREGLLNGHIRAVAGDRDGVLWAGTEYGLHRLDGEEVHVFGLDEGLADGLMTALAFDGFGRLWAGTRWGGLARFEDGIAGFEGGFAGFESGLVQMYDFDDGLADQRVLSLCADPDGGVWIGTMSGLFRLTPHEKVIRSIAGTDRYPVTALAPGPPGELLVGTMVEGLKILDDSVPRDVFTESDLGDCHIRTILTDPNGCVWIGTDSRGLIRLREKTVGSITTADGLPEGSVYALLEDAGGTLWIGTENSGLWSMRGSRITEVLNRSRGLAGDMVRVLSRDRFGRLIVGTMDGGLSILTSGRIENLATGEGLASDNVTSIVHDRGGAVWIGTDRGLSRSLDGMVEHSTRIGEFEGLTVRTLIESDAGSLYAGTRNGLWKLSDSSFERIVAGSEELELDVLSLHEDKDGGLWMGTNGGGLKRLSNRTVTTWTTRNGLPGNFIYSITEKDSSLLWMSCEAGVFSISLDSLIAFAAGELRILAPTLYDDDDGMPSDRCNGLCHPAVCTSRSGQLFYPTKGGIAVFERMSGRAPPRPPTVLIESMSSGDAELEPDGEIELSHETERVEFRFTAPDCSAPEKCGFIYMLKGYDAGFVALHPNQERKVVYRGLAPGEYEFTVRAVGNGGLWSESPAIVSFVIMPPFYRKGTFALILASGIVLAGSATAAVIQRRRIRKREMKYSTSAISEERMEKAIGGLNALMAEERVYLDPGLTLKKLAQRLNIHSNHLSRIINEHFGTSFNDYINRHRISEAQRRLADPALQKRSILDIMYDVGFYSKSTFNTAFRKFTGTSPSVYRKKHS